MNSTIKLLRYIKPYTLFAVLGPLLMCVEVAMDLLQPSLMQKIIDEGITNQDNLYVMKLGLLMLLSAIIGLFGGAGSSVFAAKASVQSTTDIRRDLFKKMTKFSNQNTDSFGTGKLITMVTNDIAVIQSAVIMTLRVFVRGPLLFIGSVTIVWLTARELFPILLVAIPIFILLIYYFTKKSSALFSNVQKAVDKLNTKLQETLVGIRVIKAFDRQDYEKKQFLNVNNLLTERTFSAEQIILTLMPVMVFIVNLAIVAGLWFGAIKVNEGVLQVGVILAFINYLNIMMSGIMSSSNVIMHIARAFPSSSRIVQLLETDIGIQEPEHPLPLRSILGDVEFKEVDFSYSKNGEHVLKSISFEARAGETIGIIGPTGSGKSTLVKLLPRLYDPDGGRILIDGMDSNQYSTQHLREAIGFVPQKAMLFSGSIEENLRYGKEDASKFEMQAAAESAAANEFIARLEKGFSYELMQEATNLSGGQKQRVSMARAFIRSPAILILDDSTSAIDAISEARVQKSIKQNYPDATVFIISAKISSIKEADKILVLEDGKIESIGTHDELLRSSKLYQDIYMSQSGRGLSH